MPDRIPTLPERLERLQSLAAQCPPQERQGFLRRIAGFGFAPRPGKAPPTAGAVAALERDLERSVRRRADRASRVPSVVFPDDLPVALAQSRIAAALAAHQVVIVSGDTGSGKTTQLPKICLAAGRGVDGFITMTQPRRIAARSVATRIASELGSTLGEAVGFKVRFDDRTNDRSLIRVVTDGVLLAEIERDPLFLRSDTIIIDEAHERSLNIDFLLGFLKRLLPRRPDLKVIVASATIDVERFSAHFGNAPVVQVEGRLYPIETRYQPIEESEIELPVAERAVKGVEECIAAGPGDILVFLGGERDIQDASDALRLMPSARNLEILPLYARLPAADQDRVFRVGRTRRVILATNVAETSVTVPGIRFVVDTGVARVARWSGRSRVLRLPVEAISQASADQRKGRCGRVGPGICLRLYSEQDFLAREAFTAPELLRTNLAHVILQMKSLGLGEVARFPFLDSPSPRLIAEGLETLTELGAVDRHGALTAIGKRMAALPVDPRVARMVLASIDEGALPEALVIAAALSIQDPRERPSSQAGAADFAQTVFRDPDSDFLSLLRLWRRWRTESAELGSGALTRWCRAHFLSQPRMREWSELYEQLRSMVSERLGIRTLKLPDESDPVRLHRSILAGFVSQLGLRSESGEYRTATGGSYAIFPGSALARRTPSWVVAAEIAETSRRFGRTLARVQGDWVEKIAPHLVERFPSEPHWVRATGQVAAWERVQFGELTLIAKRRVPWGPVAPADARNIFIQAALVDEDCNLEVPFVHHNRALRARIESLEAKRRERGLLVDSEARFAFFDARIPPEIHSLPSFERWRRKVESRNPRMLFMSERDLLVSEVDGMIAERFPDRITTANQATLELRYELEPGSAVDGIHAKIALTDLHSVDSERLEWMVPGLLAEKIEGLVRTLPKHLRIRLFPLKEVALAAAESLSFAEGSLLERAARHLSVVAGTQITPADFDPTQLPPHLSIHIEVISENGEVIGRGNDLRALRQSLAPHAAGERRSTLEQAFGDDWKLGRMRTFALDHLLEQVEGFIGHRRVIGYPMLVDCGDSVEVSLSSDRDVAERSNFFGLRRLYAIAARAAIVHHLEFAPNFDGVLMSWIASTGQGRAQLLEALILMVAGRAYLDGQRISRTPAEFEAQVDAGASLISSVSQEAVQLLGSLSARSVEVLEALDGALPASWQESVSDIRSQRLRLASPQLLAKTQWSELSNLIRYMAALGLRARKLQSSGIDRDLQCMAQVSRWESELTRAEAQLASEGADTSVLRSFGSLLEEFRVSLFAQELRTPVPVSSERLERAWRERPR